VALSVCLLGAPLFISSASAQDRGAEIHEFTEHFDWSTPASLVARTRPLSKLVEQDLKEIRAWLGLPDSPRGQLLWVEDRAQLDVLLGYKSADWFAAVTQVGQGRIIMVVGQARSQEQLHATLRHELVHWAMQGVGAEAYARLPAWFHEGVAEAWVDQHLLGAIQSPLGWQAYRNELPMLYEYNGGFGEEPLHASEGYALAYEFVERLTRLYGEDVIQEIMAELQSGRSVDAALIGITGFGLIDHEQEMRSELASLNRLLSDLYPQFFLVMTLLLLLGFPLAMRRRRQKWERVQARWAAEELENEEALDVDGQQ